MKKNSGRRTKPVAQSHAHAEETTNIALRAAILEVVYNQLRDNTPPETRETFERLQREGHSVDEAKQLIGVVVSYELFDVLKSKQPYNEARFVNSLKQLPKLPYDDEGE